MINGELKFLPAKICGQTHTILFQLKPAKLEEAGLLIYRKDVFISNIYKWIKVFVNFKCLLFLYTIHSYYLSYRSI